MDGTVGQEGRGQIGDGGHRDGQPPTVLTRLRAEATAADSRTTTG